MSLLFCRKFPRTAWNAGAVIWATRLCFVIQFTMKQNKRWNRGECERISACNVFVGAEERESERMHCCSAVWESQSWTATTATLNVNGNVVIVCELWFLSLMTWWRSLPLSSALVVALVPLQAPPNLLSSSLLIFHFCFTVSHGRVTAILFDCPYLLGLRTMSEINWLS